MAIGIEGLVTGSERYGRGTLSRASTMAGAGNVCAYAADIERVEGPARINPTINEDHGKNADDARDERTGKRPKYDRNECHTCQNRKYQDGSNDPGVSFKTPTNLTPEQAATAVRSHEMEHVTRNQAKARAEGSEIVSQSVIIKSAQCPECGRSYVSGGETRTVTRTSTQPEKSLAERYNVGLLDRQRQVGSQVDLLA